MTDHAIQPSRPAPRNPDVALHLAVIWFAVGAIALIGFLR